MNFLKSYIKKNSIVFTQPETETTSGTETGTDQDTSETDNLRNLCVSPVHIDNGEQSTTIRPILSLMSSSTLHSEQNDNEKSSSDSPYSIRRSVSPIFPKFRKSLSRQLSFTKNRSDKDLDPYLDPAPVTVTNQMMLIESIIGGDVANMGLFSHSLYKTLIEHEGDFTSKLRFCSCIIDYEKIIDPDNKTTKGLKIIDIFIKHNFLRLKNIDNIFPENVMSSLKNHELGYLHIAKNLILKDLSENPVVIKVIKDIIGD
jgi:hypothetical protein